MWFLASCEHVQDRLSDLADGELHGIERIRLRGHLVMCRACGGVARGLAATRAALGTLRDEDDA